MKPLVMLLAVLFASCEFFGDDEACYGHYDKDCLFYNGMLPLCNSESLADCHVETVCTDPEDVVVDTVSDSDSVPTEPACKQQCVGELKPCEGLSKSECRSQLGCEWYDNSSTI
ncbi:MAG TPA: hypothetical protein PLZ55_08585 [bacterium]|nr:hypothetical protein [bacterium]